MSTVSVCRCCLANGTCRQLTGVYVWTGAQEVYTDMLLESFKIQLRDAEVDTDCGICEKCVQRLRDATAFKRQVLTAERQFLRRLALVKKEGESTIKKELTDSDYHMSDDTVTVDCNDYDDKEDTLPLSTLVKSSPSKVAAKLRNSRKKIKHTTTEMNFSTTPRKATLADIRNGTRMVIGSTTIKPMTTSVVQFNPEENREQINSIARNFLEHMPYVPEKLKHKVNISAIIKCSNVTPFKDKLRKGYVCFYCATAFIDPAELREHSRVVHIEDKLKYATKLKSNDKHIKVDIAELACSVCSGNIKDLASLKDHLIAEHKKTLFRDVSDKILPFILTKDSPLYCTICSQAFETFKMLHQHMNSHFRNFVCGQCSAGFVTLRRLKFHESRHIRGEFKCDQCEKTFQSRSKLNFHVKGVHRGLWQRNKCPHCPEKFTDYYKRQKHLVEVHNETKIEYRCHACDKEFSTKCRLTNHTKSYHLQERNFKCELCLQTFYARRDLHRHMSKHSDERFQCYVCHKTFASKITLKEHSKVHASEQSVDYCDKIVKHKITPENHENAERSVSNVCFTPPIPNNIEEKTNNI